jgi:hypothetical protein
MGIVSPGALTAVRLRPTRSAGAGVYEQRLGGGPHDTDGDPTPIRLTDWREGNEYALGLTCPNGDVQVGSSYVDGTHDFVDEIVA